MAAELPRVCVYCLMALTSPASQLRIHPPDFGSDGAAFAEFHRDTQYHDLAPKVKRIQEAFADGRPVEINGQRVTEPLTTWHGDPICQTHLYDQARQLSQPQTVRMAQWGKR